MQAYVVFTGCEKIAVDVLGDAMNWLRGHLIGKVVDSSRRLPLVPLSSEMM